MITKRLYRITALLLGFGAALPLFSEQPDPVSAPVVYLGISSDAFLGIDLGFTHPLAAEQPPERVYLEAYGTLSLPVLLSISDGSLDTFAMGIGTTAEFRSSGRFSLFSDLELQALVHNDILGLSVPVIFSARMIPTLRFDTWYCGLNLQASAAVATYMHHGDTVDDTFRDIADGNGEPIDTAPTDGWYGPTGFAIRGGIELAGAPGGRVGYRISTGLVWYPSAYTGMLDAMMIGQIPFYLEAGCSYRF